MDHKRPLAAAAALLGATFILAATTASAAPIPCAVDRAHSRIQFTAHTKLFDATGTFKKFAVKGKIDPDAFEASKLSMTIQAGSIDTDNGTRDNHLKSDDFFAVDKHKTITFTSDKITKGKKPGEYIVNGTLNLKGKKTKHSIPVKVETGEMKKGDKITTVKAKFVVDRFKVGVDWPGSFLMPDIDKKVDMDIALSFAHPKG